MLAGCEFICQNRACDAYNKGFNITGPWPMGQIELVLNAPNVKRDAEFRNGLIKLKNEGQKFACITYPNMSRIPIVAYRINLWSERGHCLYKYDVEISDERTLQEAIALANIPSVCPETQCQLWNFETVINNGISCPRCSLPLKQDRWFTNEE